MTNIAKIPKRIKEAVIKYYMDKCVYLNTIAFMQWRYKYPTYTSYYNQELLAETINERIEKFFTESKPYHLIGPETIMGSLLPMYDFEEKKEENNTPMEERAESPVSKRN